MMSIAEIMAYIAATVGASIFLPQVIQIVKTKETKPQIGLTKPQRKKNLLGAFSIAPPRSFKGKTILLVDDVYTTGATVAEGAKTLSRAGAASVIVLTFARTVAL